MNNENNEFDNAIKKDGGMVMGVGPTYKIEDKIPIKTGNAPETEIVKYMYPVTKDGEIVGVFETTNDAEAFIMQQLLMYKPTREQLLGADKVMEQMKQSYESSN